MSDTQQRIEQLLKRLDQLAQRQLEFSKEINALRAELRYLQAIEPEEPVQSLPVVKRTEVHQEKIKPAIVQKPAPAVVVPPVEVKTEKSSLERFVGENLINKIGIAITIIGVAIGAKYSIDNNLISPLTRIIMGYLFGIGLLIVGIKLKAKYINFSAVLVSGAMAIMYFITYAAYSFYALMPQTAAFIVMVVFTIFTVMASLHYNKEVIALIGMVGAYAVPFLLSDGSGKVLILFSYMSILNLGILAVAINRYWKNLYYSSFALTAVIYSAWFGLKYDVATHFQIGMSFLFVFFFIFYLTFLWNKLKRSEKFDFFDVFFILINAFGLYGFGHYMLDDHGYGTMFLGYFALFNALIHFVVSVIVYRLKDADIQLRYLLSGLTLFFVAISIPIALSGSWISLSWAGMAALLFWIGRTKGESFYERVSYPLMYISFLSTLYHWSVVYHGHDSQDTWIRPLLNVNFLESMMFIAAFTFINWVNSSKRFNSSVVAPPEVKGFFSVTVQLILIISIYLAFRLEIANYWEQLYAGSAVDMGNKGDFYGGMQRNNDYRLFKVISILNYSMLFAAVLLFLNLRIFKNKVFAWLGLAAGAICLFSFLAQGLYALGELRDSFLGKSRFSLGRENVMFILVRYFSFGIVTLLLLAMARTRNLVNAQRKLITLFDVMLHVVILWIASSELINIMDLSGSTQSYKLGLSILWGVYSLFMIILGIWKKNQPLRIASIILFGITLVKLFFYDIIHLNTISKTIVLVSLGVLLLIISFLYNKYKHLIADE
ncbi:MAG: DUF2339 domain-containing protein [Chitinophagaceae bacterium]